MTLTLILVDLDGELDVGVGLGAAVVVLLVTHRQRAVDAQVGAAHVVRRVHSGRVV